jgi:ELWxxDGT repeat protein
MATRTMEGNPRVTRLAVLALIAASCLLPDVLSAQSPFLVKDIIPETGSSAPLDLTAVGRRVYFAPANDGSGQYRNLWVSDGTEAGTFRLQWINQDPLTGEGATNLFEAAGILFFRAYDNANSLDLWKSDPGTGVTAPVQDISDDSFAGQFTTPLCEFRNYLFFAADDGSAGIEPWISNGTYASMIEDIRPTPNVGSAPWGGVGYSGFLYFTAQTTEHGAELWVSDLTAPTTNEVEDIWPGPTGSNPHYHTVAAGYLFFMASTEDEGRELWAKGTTGSPFLVRDINPGNADSHPYGLTAVGDTLFFIADDGTSGRELWKSDGTEEGTQRVRDIRTGPSGSVLEPGNMPPRTWAGTQDLFFFVADEGLNGEEVWVSDGTEAGTRLVKDIFTGTGGTFAPAEFVPIADTLYFRAEDTGGVGVWQTDGTPAGTVELTAGVTGLNWVGQMVEVSGELYFVATQDSTGQELWRLPLAFFADGFESGDTDAW